MADAASLGRVHRDLLCRLSWREPWPCYVVATRGGNRALIVTEDNTNKSLARLRAYSLDTVNACIRVGWIEVGPVHRVPPYSGGKAGDSQAGQRIWITAVGRAELGVPIPAQRRVVDSGARPGVRDDQEAVRG
jgi:stage III sporulation protein SpoIIIAA